MAYSVLHHDGRRGAVQIMQCAAGTGRTLAGSYTEYCQAVFPFQHSGRDRWIPFAGLDCMLMPVLMWVAMTSSGGSRQTMRLLGVADILIWPS